MTHLLSGSSREDPKGGFGDYAKHLFGKPEHSDVTILLDNDLQEEEEQSPTKTFHGHRVILATMSDYFRTMLFGSFVEAGKKEIRLTGVPYSLFMDLMRYVYLGWNPPSDKSLEELVEYYSLSRMLLLDAKMKPCFDRWMATKVEESPEDVLMLLSLAFEWGLRHLKSRCTEHFRLIANECLALSSFVELPLQAVKYIVDLDDMNCFNDDLKTAVQAWINHHKAELSAKTIEELNKKANSRYEFGEIDDYEVNSLYGDQDQRPPEEEPADDLVLLDSILNTPQEYCYSCVIRTQGQCIILKGIQISLKPNLQYGPQYGRIKSEFQLNFEIFSSYGYGYHERDEYSRTVKVRYDFTKGERQIPVTIFFPVLYFCMGTRIRFGFEWRGVGVQPLLQQFGPISKDIGIFVTDSSYVSHLIYMEKNCRLHPDEDMEEVDDF